MSRSAVAARAAGHATDAAPYVLAFPTIAHRMRSQTVVERARLQHCNQCCPRCRRVAVEAVEADDALLDRKCAAIPGTATVVGFFCNACRHDWPVNHLQLVSDLDSDD